MDVLSTSAAYWQNWRVFVCFISLLTTISMASYVIKKYEGPKPRSTREQEEEDEDDIGVVFQHQLCKTCWRGIHPAWLLGYRMLAFFTLLFLLIVDVIAFGGQVLYFYTEWTYVLLILYFGLGSWFSAHGCYREVDGDRNDELGQPRPYQVVGIGGYIFQITYQILAGAIVLTDCVYWLLNAPHTVAKNNTILHMGGIIMHVANFPFFLGDVLFNNMQFPLFRIAYFGIWSCIFVFSHWLLHLCIPMWWPSGFLDLSHPLAPLWYFLMIFFHLPSYGVLFLLIKVKHFLLKTFLRDQ